MQEDAMKLFLLIIIVILLMCNLSVTFISNYFIYKQGGKILDFIFISSIASTSIEESVLSRMLRESREIEEDKD